MQEEHPIDDLVVVVEGEASDAVMAALRSPAAGHGFSDRLNSATSQEESAAA